MGVIFGPVLVAVYIVAGLDAVRFEWSTMPPFFWPIGLMLFASGAVLFAWSMGVNPSFEKTVRIQQEPVGPGKLLIRLKRLLRKRSMLADQVLERGL